MRLCNRADVCSKRNFIHFRKSEFTKSGFNISRCNIITELSYKCRSDLRNYIFTF